MNTVKNKRISSRRFLRIPRNTTYKDRESLLEHIETCSICYEFFLNHDNMRGVLNDE